MATPIHDFDAPVTFGPDSAKHTKFAAGVIPMWVADTDFRAAVPIIDALRARAETGVFGYVSADYVEAERAVAHWMKTRFGWTSVDPSMVIHAQAVVPALVNAIQAFTEPGDQVLIHVPIYMPFNTIIQGCGRVKVTSRMVLNEKENRYVVDWPDFEAKCSDPATKLFILCNPQNPLGRAFSADELRRMSEICLRNGVMVLSDEIHCDLVFKSSPNRHLPLPMVSPEIAQRCIVFINPSKTFNVPGLRCAMAIVPNPELRERYKALILANKSLGSNIFGSVALVAAYTRSAYFADQLMDYLQNNLELTLAFFAERIPRIRIVRPEATYLLWLDCRGLGMSPDELAAFFIEKARVGMNEGPTFGEGGDGFMRLNIATRRSVLEEGLRRIEAAVNGLDTAGSKL